MNIIIILHLQLYRNVYLQHKTLNFNNHNIDLLVSIRAASHLERLDTALLTHRAQNTMSEIIRTETRKIKYNSSNIKYFVNV